jgi:hypothetical protein
MPGSARTRPRREMPCGPEDRPDAVLTRVKRPAGIARPPRSCARADAGTHLPSASRIGVGATAGDRRRRVRVRVRDRSDNARSDPGQGLRERGGTTSRAAGWGGEMTTMLHCLAIAEQGPGWLDVHGPSAGIRKVIVEITLPLGKHWAVRPADGSRSPDLKPSRQRQAVVTLFASGTCSLTLTGQIPLARRGRQGESTWR